MNILLKKPYPAFGLELPKDFKRAKEEGVNFKIADDELIIDAIDKGSGSWEHDTWLPTITISTYRMIIYGLIQQLLEAKKSWYRRLFEKIRRIIYGVYLK